MQDHTRVIAVQCSAACFETGDGGEDTDNDDMDNDYDDEEDEEEDKVKKARMQVEELEQEGADQTLIQAMRARYQKLKRTSALESRQTYTKITACQERREITHRSWTSYRTS